MIETKTIENLKFESKTGLSVGFLKPDKATLETYPTLFRLKINDIDQYFSLTPEELIELRDLLNTVTEHGS